MNDNWRLCSKAKPFMSPARTPPPSAWHGTPDAAFDVWLDRGLASMFGPVAEEPIPPELLAAIERSRRKS